MNEQVEEADGEDEGEPLSVTDLIVGDVDHSAKASALIRLFSTFERLDIKAASEATGVPVKDIAGALPQLFAEQLAQDCLGLLLTPNNIGEFVCHGIEVINTVANAIVSLTSSTDPKLLSQLVSYMADYNGASPGSTTEVFADKKITETCDAIDDAILSKNSALVAAFTEDEGYTFQAAQALAGYDTVDEDEDEANPTVHG